MAGVARLLTRDEVRHIANHIALRARNADHSDNQARQSSAIADKTDAQLTVTRLRTRTLIMASMVPPAGRGESSR